MPVSSGAFIASVKRKPENYYIIHYSCQSLNDDNEGLSPRITSIAINHYATQQTVSFSTHAIAEELGIVRADVLTRLDEIERELLRRFYEFVRDRRGQVWVHWNMRNLTYGFEHLEHRYRVLGMTDAPTVPVEQRVNLYDVLGDRYGPDYVADPKMQSLMQLNGGLHRNFLSGAQEVEAFQKGEFIKLHNSTLCKVGFFHRVIEDLVKGRLKTSSHGWGAKLDRIFESRTTKAGALIATALTVVVGGYQLYLWLTSQ